MAGGNRNQMPPAPTKPNVDLPLPPAPPTHETEKDPAEDAPEPPALKPPPAAAKSPDVRPQTGRVDPASMKTVAAPLQKGVKVIAVREGFWKQNRMKENDVFYIPSLSDLGHWMKIADPKLEEQRQKEDKVRKLDRLHARKEKPERDE